MITIKRVKIRAQNNTFHHDYRCTDTHSPENPYKK